MATRRPPSPASLWLIGAAIACMGALAVAHGAETFGHLLPCELCVHQREVYWVTLAVALAGVVASRVRPVTAPAMATVVGLLFLVEAATAFYHAGVEWRFWPGPTSCTGTGGTVTASQISQLMSGMRVNMVRCDEAAWRFLDLSIAGWNTVAALLLAAFSFASVVMSRTRPLRVTRR